MGKTDIARWATWLSYTALLLQQALDAYANGAPWVIWVVKLAPLAVFLPGMLADNLRSFIWVCFVSLGYFMLLVQRLFVAPDNVLVIFGTAAVVVLFIAAMLYVRWRAGDIRSQSNARGIVGD